MESKEALKRIRREAGTPYFSTLYDIDMWREDFKTIEKDLDKLKQLEKIEKKLGVGLITLCKALKNGAWTKYDNEIDKCDDCEYEMLDVFIYFYWNDGKHLVFYLSDYGKCWALTKEELEKE